MTARAPLRPGERRLVRCAGEGDDGDAYIGRRRSLPRQRQRSECCLSFVRCELAGCDVLALLVSRSCSSSTTTSYVRRRTYAPIALCVNFSVADIYCSPLHETLSDPPAGL